MMDQELRRLAEEFSRRAQITGVYFHDAAASTAREQVFRQVAGECYPQSPLYQRPRSVSVLLRSMSHPLFTGVSAGITSAALCAVAETLVPRLPVAIAAGFGAAIANAAAAYLLGAKQIRSTSEPDSCGNTVTLDSTAIASGLHGYPLVMRTDITIIPQKSANPGENPKQLPLFDRREERSSDR